MTKKSEPDIFGLRFTNKMIQDLTFWYNSEISIL